MCSTCKPRKEFNGTLMTSVAAGKGNNKKKEAELISNFFKTGGENLSVIAKSGNRNMTSANKDNRQDNVAVNFLKKFGKKIHLNGNVMYSNAINGNEGTSYYEQYLKTGNRYRYATSDRHNTNRMASTMLSMKWNIDKMTLLNLSGSFSAMKGTNGSDSRQATYNETRIGYHSTVQWGRKRPNGKRYPGEWHPHELPFNKRQPAVFPERRPHPTAERERQQFGANHAILGGERKERGVFRVLHHLLPIAG